MTDTLISAAVITGSLAKSLRQKRQSDVNDDGVEDRYGFDRQSWFPNQNSLPGQFPNNGGPVTFPWQNQNQNNGQRPFPWQNQNQNGGQGPFPWQNQNQNGGQGQFPWQNQNQNNGQDQFPWQNQNQQQSTTTATPNGNG